MTRNNLNEHLSWLLNSKLSIPAAGDALPPVSISFTQAEPTPAETDSPNRTTADGEKLSEEEDITLANAQAAPRTDEMARLRTETGSASSRPGLVTMGPRMLETLPQNTMQSIPAKIPTSTARVDAAPRPTSFSIARQVPFSPKQDVEIMDLTESLQQAREAATNQVAGRKRKSSEMLQELPVNTPPKPRPAPPAPAMLPPPRGSQQSFTAIDEIFEAPSEPPPPYSTLAPVLGPPSRGAACQTSIMNPLGTTSGPPESPVMPDSEADEDDLVDFNRSRSRTPACKKQAVEKQKTLFPERVAESPSKPSALTCGDSLAVPDGDVDKALRTTFSPDRTAVQPLKPPQDAAALANSSQGEAQSEDQALVEQLFALESDEIEACCQRFNDEYERRLEQVTDCMENDLDTDELQKLLDVAEERRNSIHVLANKRKDYTILADEREQLRAALKAAIRAKSGVDNARAATGACRSQTQTLLRGCVYHLNICKAEVLEVLRKASEKDGNKKIAVESTQAQPANLMPKQPCVPSSSRIAQTQTMHAYHQSDTRAGMQTLSKDSPPNIEAYFSPPRQKGSSVAKPLQRSGQRTDLAPEDENEYGYLNDSDMLEATNQVFSNRMGTPPTRPDEDEFEDEIMLDFAEDLENYSVRRQPTNSTVARPPLAPTSGNSQTLTAAKIPKKKKKRTPSKVDDANLEHLFRFPWSDSIKETLRDWFRLRGFRENQLEAINATLAGKDVFVLMPTGGGKSLCYQLPALIDKGKTLGVTVVISPLLSLMEDQVQHLRKLGIQACLINSETPRDARDAVMEAMSEEKVEDYLRLLYVTPEMLSKSQKMINAFERLYRRQRLARLVIDEAHCVSQWGHDFRPDYKLIGDVRKRFPTVPVMALTATATENVKLDTVHNLGITGCQIFTSSFNRPNLYYEVRPKPKGKEDVKHIAELIKGNYHRKSGIIYCLSRKNCESMAAALLKDHKIKAHHYHAGLEPQVKRRIQKDWQAGVHHVIVATIAFGMGIDKPDVRFVIHHTIPKSLEGYYQETGRAGRDQMDSGCYLFYGYQDVSKLRRMIDDGEGDWEQKERQHQMLRRMAQYCDNRSDCRRVQVLRYFNEDFDANDCDGKCDNCCSGSSFQTVDFTEYAQQAVSLVGKLASQKATLLLCMDVFRGAATKKITDGNMNELNEYGAGKDLDRGDVERLFYHLLTERAIVEENVVNKGGFANQYAMLGKHCADFRNGKKKLFMQMRSTPKPKAKALAKKKAKGDPYQEQSKKWNKTAGSGMPAEMPMSTNISSPVQAATGRRKPNQRKADLMLGNGYRRDDVGVSDPEDEDYTESDDDSFDDGFVPVRVADGPQRSERKRGLSRPITADGMLNDLDEVARDAIEQFVQEGKEVARKIVVDNNLRMVPFSDTMLRHMAIMRTITPDEMLNIPEVNPENVRLFGKRFCRLVQGFIERYDEIIQPASRIDPNARNVIDLVSDEEEESEDEYGEFPSEDEEGETSGYFQPHPPPSAAVASFNARVGQMQAEHAHNESGPAKRKKGAKGGKKRNWKATGSTAAPRRNGFSGDRFTSYAYEGPSAAGVAKKKASGKRKNGEGGRSGGGTSRGGGRNTTKTTAGNRSIVAMMPT